MLFSLQNKSIESLSLQTPRGCMGEGRCFFMKATRTGALEYRGIANVELLGHQVGSVNPYEFDSIASVIETTGFLDLRAEENRDSTSVGNTEIGVEFVSGRKYLFIRDALHEPPIFWAAAKLIELLLQKAKWGQIELEKAERDFAKLAQELS